MEESAPGLADDVETFVAGDGSEATRERFDELFVLHERAVEAGDEASAKKLRRAFLKTLDDASDAAIDERLAGFLSDHVEPSDFAELRWESPERVARFCEMLYGFQFPDDETAERMRRHAAGLLRAALKQCEERGDYESMLRLAQTVPTSPNLLRGELLRLRNRIYLYEMARVRRRKRGLYAYLAIQAFFVLVVFPFLFVYTENGVIREAVGEATDIELPEVESPQYLGYLDGLYWSTITASSIGYGDVTPRSDEGRIMASVLGTMGVITVGVVAGLVLNWITPRRLD